MALRHIVTKEDNILHKICREQVKFDERLHQLLDDMAETLENANGVGLAAPQVGILRRVVLVIETNVEDEEDEEILELINPVIVSSEGEQTGAEGIQVVGNKFVIYRKSEKLERERKAQAQPKAPKPAKKKVNPVKAGIRSRRKAAKEERERRDKYFHDAAVQAAIERRKQQSRGE